MSTPPEARPGDGRVGYLGPEGTFTEEALLDSAAAGAVEPVALASIYDTVMALRRGDVRWAIVPIENSLEGSINVTLDLLAGEASDVRIVGEALLRVRHSLIAASALPLAEIDTVITHPQVPGQCTRLLRGELAHAQVLAASSTAEAVRSVVLERVPGRAALGTAAGGEDLRRDRHPGGRPGPRGQRNPLRVAGTSVGSGQRTAAAGRRHDEVEDIAGVLGARRGASRLAGSLSAGVRRSGHQPHEDRVASTAGENGQLHVLRRPQRAS